MSRPAKRQSSPLNDQVLEASDLPVGSETDDAPRTADADTVPGLTNEGPRTQAGKETLDDREDKVRTALYEEMLQQLAKAGITGLRYKFHLIRVLPRKWRTPGGKMVSTEGNVETYVGSPPDADEIRETHGPGSYTIQPYGPDPTTGKHRSFPAIPIDPIIGAPGDGPKTYANKDGTMELEHADRLRQDEVGNGLVTVMGDMQKQTMVLMKDVLTENRTQLRDLMQQRNAAPVIDPNLAEERREREAQRARDHALMLAKMEQDGADRRAAETRAAEERRASEKERRDADAQREKDRAEEAKRQEAQRQRDHDKEMARIAADSARQIADAAAARAQADKQHAEIVAALKESGKKKDEEDPEVRLLRTIELVDKVRGKDDDKGSKEDGEIRAAVAKTITDIPNRMENMLTKFLGFKEKENKKPAVPAAEKTPMKRDTVALPPIPQLEPHPEEPQFTWPDDTTDKREIAKMLGGNIEAALNAKWTSERISKEVVARFPDWLRMMMRQLPTDEIVKMIEEHAPGDATLRTPRGRASIRALHGLLRRERPPEPPAELEANPFKTDEPPAPPGEEPGQVPPSPPHSEVPRV